MSKIIRYRCDFCGCETTAEMPDAVKLFYNCGCILDMSFELCAPCYKKLIRYINNERKGKVNDNI